LRKPSFQILDVEGLKKKATRPLKIATYNTPLMTNYKIYPVKNRIANKTKNHYI